MRNLSSESKSLQCHVNRSASLVLLLLLFACGNGNSGADQGSVIQPPVNNATGFKDRCLNPRTGIDPSTNAPFPDVAGSQLDENSWLRDWSSDTYLWYNEITPVDPTGYTSTAYFDKMKTFALTASGNAKDKYHFSLPTVDWLKYAQSGVIPGYGVQWAALSTVPPRKLVVAYIQPNSPASIANLARGAEILTVDGVDLINSVGQIDIDTINAGLNPATVGETHTFTVRDLNSTLSRTITLQSQDVASTPVQHVKVIPTATGNVGYMLFLDHMATAEQALIDAVNQLQAAGISDLVLDLRYNGGGYLAIASELAYMIAGEAATAGLTFETTKFNAKHPTINPVTGQSITPIPFLKTAQGFSAPSGQVLPTLNLPRLFVLTGTNTCSASESIMNSLTGIGVEVIQIGDVTCGKPYGYYPTGNCGMTYFSIQVKGLNAKGFGDYTDGFIPSNSVAAVGGAVLPGCVVSDDFNHAFGDVAEGRLAEALQYRTSNGCSLAQAFLPRITHKSVNDPQLYKPEWFNNRLLTRPHEGK